MMDLQRLTRGFTECILITSFKFLWAHPDGPGSFSLLSPDLSSGRSQRSQSGSLLDGCLLWGPRRSEGFQASSRRHCLLAWVTALPKDLHLSLQLQFTSMWHKTVSQSCKYTNGIRRKENKNKYKISYHEVLCYFYALPEVLGWLLCPKKLYQKPGHLFDRMLCECI